MEKSNGFYAREYESCVVKWLKCLIIWQLMVLFILDVFVTFTPGCSYNNPRVYGAPGASPQPETPWNPPKQVIEKQEGFQAITAEAEKKAPLIPSELLNNIYNLDLADIINIALLNSKQTRRAWEQARSAAASYRRELGSYLPNISGDASSSRQKNPAIGERFSSGTNTYSASASLNWLIFNFGGRRASVEKMREALFAADWNHNATIQNVILQVEQAYYDYSATKALLAAQQATVDESQTNLNAAEDRHTAGVATLSDVLQARTALSQSFLSLETLKGQIMTTRGILATAMGLPANTTFDVDFPVGALPFEQTKKSIEEYLETALKERPDLAAARAQVLEANAQVRAVRAQGYPSIEANGSIGQQYLNNFSNSNNNYIATIGISVPLFTGFSHQWDIFAAQAQANAAYAQAQNIKDLVTLQVWTSYYNLETAEHLVHTSDDLLASASQNQDVAVARYKDGVGSIIDLLTAQTALESARAQQIRARAEWWIAIAQLAHDTGTLEVSSTTGNGNEKKTYRKEGK